ncbi:hypothetical protein C3L33_19601, partial [Rhododendron williamsianum]
MPSSTTPPSMVVPTTTPIAIFPTTMPHFYLTIMNTKPFYSPFLPAATTLLLLPTLGVLPILRACSTGASFPLLDYASSPLFDVEAWAWANLSLKWETTEAKTSLSMSTMPMVLPAYSHREKWLSNGDLSSTNDFHLHNFIQVLSTSAVPNHFQGPPQPQSDNYYQNGNGSPNQWNGPNQTYNEYGNPNQFNQMNNPNQNYPGRGNPNPGQGYSSPPRGSPDFPNQSFTQGENPSRNTSYPPPGNDRQWNYQNQGPNRTGDYPQRGVNGNQNQSYPRRENPSQTRYYPQHGANQLDGQNQAYPQHENPSQTRNYPQHGVNQLDGQNQAYPQRENPSQTRNYPQRGVNQFDNQNQAYPQRDNRNQTQNYPQRDQFDNQNQAYPQCENPSQTRNYPQRGVNQFDNQNQAYPQRENRNQTQNYPQRGVNQFDNQNQAYPQRDNRNQTQNQAQNQGQVKEVIEFMEQGVSAMLSVLMPCDRNVLKMWKYDRCTEGFDHMPERNMDSWHLMINGYAGNGMGDDGLGLFEQMRELGLQPNEQTFLSVLSACASADAVEEGFLHFESMKTEYGMSAGIEHYLGLLDVLGHPGHVHEAFEFIENLPFEPTAVIWEALRNYARIHGDIDLEDHAEELMVLLDFEGDS